LTVDAAPRGRADNRSPLAGVIEQAAGAMLAQGFQNDQAARAAAAQTAPTQQQHPQQHRQQPRPQQRPPQRPQRPQEPHK